MQIQGSMFCLRNVQKEMNILQSVVFLEKKGFLFTFLMYLKKEM